VRNQIEHRLGFSLDEASNFMLKCIIVADQAQTVQTLKSHIRKTPFLELVSTFKNPKEALTYLKGKPADIVFMRQRRVSLTDKSQIRIFQLHAMVIAVASNKVLAYDAMEIGAVDFLLEPILYDRFFRAAEKAYKMKFAGEATKPSLEMSQLKGGFIFIKEATRLLRLELDDIYYVMGLKNYVSIMTKSHRIVSLQTMKQMEELLPGRRFIRVHRSYLVALDKIISIEKQQIHVKDKVIPIGSLYLTAFMKKISKMGNH
jgi:DNA-binding LytR/AlgR family response regulator